jgi:hypothetical protein
MASKHLSIRVPGIPSGGEKELTVCCGTDASYLQGSSMIILFATFTLKCLNLFSVCISEDKVLKDKICPCASFN